MESFLARLRNLELKTDSGKINYRWGLILAALVAALTGKDWFLSMIALAVGTIKTWVLKENIKEEIETANVFLLIFLVIFFFVLCIEILYYEDKKKRKIESEIKKEGKV